MDGEDVVLAILVAAPVAAWLGARAWLRRFRTGRGGARPRRRDVVAGNLLVLVFLLSVACLAGECWFRFAYDTTDSFGLLRTSERWFARHSARNSLGFRDDEEYDVGRMTGGRRRVDFVGDSFTAGHGVPRVGDRFANLARAARPGWQVHVFARNGADTGLELQFVEGEADEMAGGRYRCDLVVLVYCLNDVSDMMPEMQALHGRIHDRRERGVLARSSWLADWLRFLWIVRTEPDMQDYYASLETAYSGPLWDAQCERLRRFHAAVAAHGGRLAVVTFPFLQSLGPKYPYRDVHRRLAEFWAKENVPELDLLPTFDLHAGENLVVGRWDAHPNERAHALAADAIVPFVDRVLGE